MVIMQIFLTTTKALNNGRIKLGRTCPHAVDSDPEIDSDEINVSKILRTEYVQRVLGFLRILNFTRINYNRLKSPLFHIAGSTFALFMQ